MKLLRDLQAYHYYWLGIAHYRGLFYQADPVVAASYLTKAATLGMAAAQNLLGLMHIEGEGVPRHFREAFRWFRESADQDDPDGNCYLGLMYASGQGVVQDWKLAEHHWLKAARAENAESMYFIGLLHYAGIERPVSHPEAIAWFEKSAEFGYAPAAHAIGCLHRSGEHPSADKDEAIKWFQLAADREYGPSLFALGSIYEAPGDHHNADMAATCYKKAALSGETDAMFRMGMMYLEQQGTTEAGPFSEFLALGWLKKAVEENHAGAAYVLGCLYQGGEGVFFEPDGKRLAIACFRKAAMLGDKRADTKLKWLDGADDRHADRKDLSAMVPHTVRPPILKWMHLTREKREMEQLYESARRFYQSEQGKSDPARAAEYFRLCSAAGSAEADYMLGHMYEHGEGVARDVEQARKWYEAAAKKGNKDAACRLRNMTPGSAEGTLL